MKTDSLKLLALACLLAAGCAGPQAKKAEIKKKKKIELQALKHYRTGIDAYVNTRYAEAVAEWKKTLELKPDYPNAGEYIKRAEKAQEALKTLKKATPQPLDDARQN